MKLPKFCIRENFHTFYSVRKLHEIVELWTLKKNIMYFSDSSVQIEDMETLLLIAGKVT